MVQFFKGDLLEQQIYEAANGPLTNLAIAKDSLFNEAFSAAPLGDVIWNLKKSPLSNAIKKSIFRESFKEIFDAFVKVGTFEAYLTVFRKIFGDNVEVTFTVPGPGQLQIDIVASGVEYSTFLTRYILSNQYVFDEIIDDVGDNIVFSTVRGFASQYELEQMLFELVPGGIFTEITLTLEA